MIKKLLIIAIIIVAALFVTSDYATGPEQKTEETPQNSAEAHRTIFYESFDAPETIEESPSMKKSKNENWWVSSGAYFFIENNVGRTISGDLPTRDRWARAFRRSNPTDTKNGLRPQNIFRLVSQIPFLNGSQEVYARISFYEPSESPNRNESNGILLFNRYQNEHTLYYTGVRVDGNVVVKKKLNGIYTTLGITPIIETGADYDRTTNPNLLPIDTWIGIRSVVRNIDDDNVEIELFTDIGKTGEWTSVLTVIDDGVAYGPIISQSGFGGIRTDFMDVALDDYAVEKVW